MVRSTVIRAASLTCTVSVKQVSQPCFSEIAKDCDLKYNSDYFCALGCYNQLIMYGSRYEDNLIEHAVQEGEDAGAFYGVGNEYALVNLGNVIRNNTFRHIRPLDRLHLDGPKSPALYFDNGLSSYLVENNRCEALRHSLVATLRVQPQVN